MSKYDLNFNTGTQVKPYEAFESSIGPGGIFAQILKQNDADRAVEKEQAIRAAERAEAKAERNADREYARSRDKLIDDRYNLDEARKQRTNDLVLSMNQDIGNDKLGNILTDTQVADLEKRAGSGATAEDINAAYNQFVAQNKASPAHALKMMDKIDYGTKTDDNGNVIQADAGTIMKLKQELAEPLQQAYALNIFATKGKAVTEDQLAKKYLADTGRVMPAGVQSEINKMYNNEFDKGIKLKQLDLDEERVRIAKEGNNIQKQIKQLEANQKKLERTEGIIGLSVLAKDLGIKGELFETDKNGNVIVKKMQTAEGPVDVPLLKVGMTDETKIKNQIDRYQKVHDAKTERQNAILDKPLEYIRKESGVSSLDPESTSRINNLINSTSDINTREKLIKGISANVKERYFFNPADEFTEEAYDKLKKEHVDKK